MKDTVKNKDHGVDENITVKNNGKLVYMRSLRLVYIHIITYFITVKHLKTLFSTLIIDAIAICI